jgi:hypothetical protein
MQNAIIAATHASHLVSTAAPAFYQQFVPVPLVDAQQLLAAASMPNGAVNPWASAWQPQFNVW